MSYRPKVSWFPWLLFVYVLLQSAIWHSLYNKSVENSDRPLLFVIIFIVLWIERKSIVASLQGKEHGSLSLGVPLFVAGWLLYLAGRLYPIMIMEILGLFIIPAGLVAMLAPREFQRSALFIAFSGTVIVLLGWTAPDLLSTELAQAIASMTATLVDALFFPVVASGVTLYFGPHVAEVSKACSGMNSIFSLTALSVLYLRSSLERSLPHTAILVALVLPVAIVTNLFRVMVLVLVTHYIGEGLAHSTFHEGTGVFVFIVALSILALIDQLLFRFFNDNRQKKEGGDAPTNV